MKLKIAVAVLALAVQSTDALAENRKPAVKKIAKKAETVVYHGKNGRKVFAANDAMSRNAAQQIALAMEKQFGKM